MDARFSGRERLAGALVLVAFALALRWHDLGDPIAGLDEQFYLLVGDRIWHGAWPYVGIWDRKPAGLFLFYAAIRAFPGDGILAYQLIATGFLAATGWVVAQIARPIMSAPAAWCAGLVTILYGVVLGLGFGEAPIFYDLLVAIAAWRIAATRPGDIRAGAAAMLLAGIAITIKTNAVFEGIALGLVLLDRERRTGLAPSRLCIRALGYAALGAAPMLAILAAYALTGHFAAFWFANIVSILHKSGGMSAESMAGLVACVIVMAPLLILGLVQVRRVPSTQRRLLAGWLLGSVLGFAAIGFFHFHYALPMVAPLAILSAWALHRRVAGAACLLLGAFALVGLMRGPGYAAQDRADVARLVRLLPAGLTTECLFVYEGPTILYHLTNACLPGRYVFPGHFTDAAERDALERPSAAILRETLASRPAAIVSVPGMREGAAATPNDRILAAALARGYRAAGRQTIRLYGSRRVTAVVWVRDPRTS